MYTNIKNGKLKVGIIGCGIIAGTKHIPSLSKLDNVEIGAFFDVDIEKAKKVSVEYGYERSKIYDDYEKLLENEDIDVIHVCTPNKYHSQITIKALKAGKYVMCEKPMALSTAEAREMVEVSKSTGKKLTISFQNRFKADSQYLHRICENGELGEIYLAKALAIRRRGVPTWGKYLSMEEQGGGPLVDIGSHSLDLALWMMNNYRPKFVVGNVYNKIGSKKGSVNEWGPWDPEKFMVEDSAFGFITMENGATIILETSWALNSLQDGGIQTVLCGTEGGADTLDGVRLNGEKNGALYSMYPSIGKNKIAFNQLKVESPNDIEIRLWIECILNDTLPVVKAEEALVVTEILDAIYISANTKKPVYFNNHYML